MACAFLSAAILFCVAVVLAVQACWPVLDSHESRERSGFLLNLATALLRGFTGYFMIRYPLTGAIALTIVLAFFFCVSGIFRIVGSSALRYPRWGWSVLSGAVSVILGVLLLSQLPLSSLWFIGFAVGLDLILEGISLVTFATALHRTPERVILDQAA